MNASTTITFLDTHSGAIQAISTTILVLITFYYALKTRETVREAVNTRKDSKLPLLKITRLEGPIKSYESKNYLYFEIENIGYGPAIDAHIKIPRRAESICVGSITNEKETVINITLEEKEPETLNGLPEIEKKIYIEYKDIFGRRITTETVFKVKTNSNASESWFSFSIGSWKPIIPN